MQLRAPRALRNARFGLDVELLFVSLGRKESFMQEPQVGDKSGALGIASLVLAIIAGAWSAIGATYPGALVGLVAAALGFIARSKAGATGTPRIVATLGLSLGLLVAVASIVLTAVDKSA
jgi:hypothetical protein